MAAGSVGVSLVLLGLNLCLAFLSGSLALAAESTHNLADLAASIAVLAGLRLSRRHSQAFPYGLYKIENLVSLVVAVGIFLTGWEIAREALQTGRAAPEIRAWMIPCVVAGASLALLFSRYELRVGRELNSPSLQADAREFQAHVLSGTAVLAAMVGDWTGLPVDRPAALLIVLWIGRVAWQTLVDAVRVLLDVSVDRVTLAEAERILRGVPGVVDVAEVSGRSAGRYRFLEAQVVLRTRALERAHEVGQEAERRVRAGVAHVERVRVSSVPRAPASLRIAVPLDDPSGRVSDHFGTAPWFAIAVRRSSDGALEQLQIVANPQAAEPRGRGLRVADWLLGLGIDVLATRDDIRDKGPGYALDRAGVVVQISAAHALDGALAEVQRV